MPPSRRSWLTLVLLASAAGLTAACAEPARTETVEPGAANALTLSDVACLSVHYSLGSSDRSTASRRRQLDLLEELGVRKVRRGLSWHRIEKTRGDFSFDSIDAGIDDTTSRGVEMIAMLAYGVPWATTATDDDPFYPPDDPADFGDFAEEVVRRYGDRIRLWEIWNEQNSGFRFWRPNLGGDPTAYAALLREAARGIREANDQAQVLYGGLFHHPQAIPGAVEFLTGHFAARREAAADFDALAMHPYPLYPPSVPPESIEADEESFPEMFAAQRAVLTANGARDIPIHVTEYGWPVYDKVTRTLQAAYLVRGMLLIAAEGGRSACWYTLDDGKSSGDFPPEGDFGLLAYDPDHFDDGESERKPSFVALKTLLATVGDMAFVEDVTERRGLAPGTRAHLLARKDGSARAHLLWTVHDGEATIELPRAEGTTLRVLDVLGTEQEVQDADVVRVHFGPVPVVALEIRRGS